MIGAAIGSAGAGAASADRDGTVTQPVAATIVASAPIAKGNKGADCIGHPT